MSAAPATNGNPRRKQLSDQLDRMDAILDVLAEGLPGAVADACRDGARLAIKDALVQVLTDPELRALVAPVPPEPAPAEVPPAGPPEPAPAGPWSGIKAAFARIRAAVTGAADKARGAAADQCKVAGEAVTAVGRATGEVLNRRRVLWVSLGVGLAIGLACLLVPHAAAAAVTAVTATATAAAVQTGTWLKRAARRCGLVN